MTILRFRAPARDPSSTLVVFADLQLEYVAAGRAHSLAETEACIANCRQLLNSARNARLPIAHFRQIRADTHFNKQCRFSGWIDGFQPRANEMVYERSLPSCYANDDFCGFLEHVSQPVFLLAGLSGEQACLSTAIDAHHRDHGLVFIRDCSATTSLAGLSETQSHDALCDLISKYADILPMQVVLKQLGRSSFM